MTWDVVCVGSGLTALAFGAFYQKRYPGRRVLVIDKHSLAGGYATEFGRPKAKATFDCSLHKISGIWEGGNLRRLLTDLGIFGSLDLVYHAELFSAVSADGSMALPLNPCSMQSVLTDAFPRDAAGIRQFFEDTALHGRNGYFQFQISTGAFDADLKAMRYARKHLQKTTVAEAINRLVVDPKLREILCAPTIYVGGFPENLSYLYYLHVIYANIYQGTAYVAGSGQRLSNLIAGLIEAGGGQVLLGRLVTKILVGPDDAVTGVLTSDGVTHESKTVVVNASPQFALENLLDPKPTIARARTLVDRLKASHATTTLYMVLDRPPAEIGLGSAESMLFSENHDRCAALRQRARDHPGDEVAHELAYWHASPMEVTNYHALDPRQNFVLVANVLDMADHWPSRANRASYPAYKEKKRRATVVLLDRMADRWPALRSATMFAEMATPATYQRFTNNFAGAGYGALVGADISAHSFHYGFPIKGVHFMSAWTAGPGYEAVIGYGEARARAWRA